MEENDEINENRIKFIENVLPTWKNRHVLTPCASFRLTRENFQFLTRISVLAGGSFLFWFT